MEKLKSCTNSYSIWAPSLLRIPFKKVLMFLNISFSEVDDKLIGKDLKGNNFTVDNDSNIIRSEFYMGNILGFLNLQLHLDTNEAIEFLMSSDLLYNEYLGIEKSMQAEGKQRKEHLILNLVSGSLWERRVVDFGTGKKIKI
jgi:hypothetical protein